MNFFKALRMTMKYGGAIVLVLSKAQEAMADGELSAPEIADIVQTAVAAADIPGVHADMIGVNVRTDGGFSVDFPAEAIDDWKFKLAF